MDDTFRRDYLARLPLPLAQLYSRAYNAKQARARHDNAFYLCEALIKLTAAPAIVSYLNGAERVESIDEQMIHLKLPALGHWLGLLRELARYFGDEKRFAGHPLGHLWQQLNTRKSQWEGVVVLYRRIKNGPDGQTSNIRRCSPLEVFDALVQYRNTVFGHGASRTESFYEEEMGPLLLPAVNDLLAEGVLDILGPNGSRLFFVSEIRALAADRMQLELRELVGRESERAAPLELSIEQITNLEPGCVVVQWPGHSVPQRLDPLLRFRETDLTDEVLFLNRDRSGKHVEYLSYTTGQTVRYSDMEPALRHLLAKTAHVPSGAHVSTASDHNVDPEESAESSRSPAGGLAAAPSIADFEVLSELGRGGMGVVYLARQLSLGRLVALKTLSSELLDDEIALARFRREMRVLGRCDHPNIVKVYSCGALPDGQLYYAMEYVPGADLDCVWRELSGTGDRPDRTGSNWSAAVRSASQKQLEHTKRIATGDTTSKFLQHAAQSATGLVADATDASSILPTLPDMSELPESDEEDMNAFQHRVAGLIHDAASALQAVHDQNVVHRDVKPANLILTADGSRVVLMDFGLAKGQSTALTSSRAGGLLGTLRYSAPEQLAAANMAVGPTADVRGLGATMWELLTRQRLFGDANDERQLATWVLNRDVPLLRSVDPLLDAELEAITAKATERDVESRIQSTRELADYLEMYLTGKPVTLGRPNRLAKVLAQLAVPIVILAALIPNIAAGAFNLIYNQNEIVRHLSVDSLRIFWRTQTIINAIAYPLGIFLVGLFAFRASRLLFGERDVLAATPDALRDARRGSLLLGHRTALIDIGLWVLAGVMYPIALHVASGDLPVSAYAHFFGSLTLCGLVAAAYPFFLITWFSLRVLYPSLCRGRAYTTEDQAALQRLDRLSWTYFMCAAAVPMFTVAILAMIDTGSRFALGVFGIGGLVGFAAVAAIFRHLQATLRALAN